MRVVINVAFPQRTYDREKDGKRRWKSQRKLKERRTGELKKRRRKGKLKMQRETSVGRWRKREREKE